MTRQDRADYITQPVNDEINKLLSVIGGQEEQPDPSEFSLIRTAQVLATNFVQGFTTLPVGQEAHNTIESIAASIGHLAGFVGVLFPEIRVAGKVGRRVTAGTTTAWAIKKLAGTKSFQKTLGEAASRTVFDVAEKVAAFRSVPMWAADKAVKQLEKIGVYKKGVERLAKKSRVAAQLHESGMHLGIASAVSNWTQGLGHAVESAAYGYVYGGAFAGIGNLPFAKDNTTVSSVLKAAAGSMLQGVPTTLQGADLETQVYDYLLGAYFGYTSTDAVKHEAMKYVSKLESHERVEVYAQYRDEAGREVTPDIPEFKKEFLDKDVEVQKEIINQLNEIYKPEESQRVLNRIFSNFIKSGYVDEQTREAFLPRLEEGNWIPVEDVSSGDYVVLKGTNTLRRVIGEDNEGNLFLEREPIDKTFKREEIIKVTPTAEDLKYYQETDVYSKAEADDHEFLIWEYQNEDYDSAVMDLENPVRKVIEELVNQDVVTAKRREMELELIGVIKDNLGKENGFQIIDDYLRKLNESAISKTAGAELDEKLVNKVKKVYNQLSKKVPVKVHYLFYERGGKSPLVESYEEQTINGVGKGVALDAAGNRIPMTTPETTFHRKLREHFDGENPIEIIKQVHREDRSGRVTTQAFNFRDFTEEDHRAVATQLIRKGKILDGGKADKPEFVVLKVPKHIRENLMQEVTKYANVYKKMGIDILSDIKKAMENRAHAWSVSGEAEMKNLQEIFLTEWATSIWYSEQYNGLPLERMLEAKKTTKIRLPKDIETTLGKIEKPLVEREVPGDVPIEESEDIVSATGEPGAAKYVRDENKVLVNRKLLRKKFEERAWTKPKKQRDGSYATPLPEDAFKTYEEWERFVIEREKAHARLSKEEFGKDKPYGKYEDEVNRMAFEALEENLELPDSPEIITRIYQGDETLTKEELMQIKGIGERRAGKILNAIRNPEKIERGGNFIDNPINVNKRVQIRLNSFPRVTRDVWEISKKKFNVPDELENFVVAIDPADCVNCSYKVLKPESDGADIVHTRIMDAHLDSAGMNTSGGYIKPFVHIADSEYGALLEKSAWHRSTDKLSEAMEKRGLGHIKFISATKQYGFRKPYIIEYDAKTNEIEFYEAIQDGKKWRRGDRVNNPEKYKQDIEDVSINPNKEDKKVGKRTSLMAAFVNKPMYGIGGVTEEYMRAAKGWIDKVNKGEPFWNKKAKEFFNSDLKNETAFNEILENLHLIDINILLDVMGRAGTDPLFRSKLLRAINYYANNANGNGELILDVEEMTSGDFDPYSMADRSPSQMLLDLDKDGALSLSAKRQDELLSGFKKFIRKRLTTPKVNYSGESIMRVHDPEIRSRIEVKDDEIYFDDNRKEEIIPFYNADGAKVEMKLGDAWDLYNKIKGEEGYDDVTRKMEDAFEIIVARAPIDDVNGIAVLKFKGFTGVKGGGMLISGNTMNRLGGADLDIDSAKWYFNAPKDYRNALKKVDRRAFYELPEYKIIEEVLSGDEHRQGDPLKLHTRPFAGEAPSKYLAMYDTWDKVSVGHATSKGRNPNMGTSTTNSMYMGAFYSQAIKNGGVYTSRYNDPFREELGEEGKPYITEIELKARDDEGRALRVISALEMNTSVDIAKLGQIYKPAEMKASLLGAAFQEIKIRLSDGTEKVIYDQPDFKSFVKGVADTGEEFESLVEFAAGNRDYISPAELRRLEKKGKKIDKKQKAKSQKLYSDPVKRLNLKHVLDYKRFTDFHNKVFKKDRVRNKQWPLEDAVSSAFDFPEQMNDTWLGPIAETFRNIKRIPTLVDIAVDNAGKVPGIMNSLKDVSSQFIGEIEKVYSNMIGREIKIPRSYSPVKRKLKAIAPHWEEGRHGLRTKEGRKRFASDNKNMYRIMANLIYSDAELNPNAKRKIGYAFHNALKGIKGMDVDTALKQMAVVIKATKDELAAKPGFERKEMQASLEELWPEARKGMTEDEIKLVERKQGGIMKTIKTEFLNPLTGSNGKLFYPKSPYKFNLRFLEKQVKELNDYFTNDISMYASMKVLKNRRDLVESYLKIRLVYEVNGQEKEGTLEELVVHNINVAKNYFADLAKGGSDPIDVDNAINAAKGQMLKAINFYNQEASKRGSNRIPSREVMEWFDAELLSPLMLKTRMGNDFLISRDNLLGVNAVSRSVLQEYVDEFNNIASMFLPENRISRAEIKEYWDTATRYNEREFKPIVIEGLIKERVHGFFVKPGEGEISPEMELLAWDITNMLGGIREFAEDPELIPKFFRYVTQKADATSTHYYDLIKIRYALESLRTGTTGFEKLKRSFKEITGKEIGFEMGKLAFSLNFPEAIANKAMVDDIVFKTVQDAMLTTIDDKGKMRVVYGEAAEPMSHMKVLIDVANSGVAKETEQWEKYLRPLLNGVWEKWQSSVWGVETGSKNPDKPRIIDLAIRRHEYYGISKEYRKAKQEGRLDDVKRFYRKMKTAERRYYEGQNLYNEVKDREYRIKNDNGNSKIIKGEEMIELARRGLRDTEKIFRALIIPEAENLIDVFKPKNGLDIDYESATNFAEEVFTSPKLSRVLTYDFARYLAHEHEIDLMAERFAGRHLRPKDEQSIWDLNAETPGIRTFNDAIEVDDTHILSGVKWLVSSLPKDIIVRRASLLALERGLKVNYEDLIANIEAIEMRINPRTGKKFKRGFLNAKQQGRLQALKFARRMRGEMINREKLATHEELQDKLKDVITAVRHLKDYHGTLKSYGEDTVTRKLFGKGIYSQLEQDLQYTNGLTDNKTWYKRMQRFFFRRFYDTELEEGYFPHKGFRLKDIQRQFLEIANKGEIGDLSKFKAQEEQVLNENVTEHGEGEYEVTKVFDADNQEESFRLRDINMRPSSLLSRDLDLDGYRRDTQSLLKAAQEINKTIYSISKTVLGRDVIRAFDKSPSKMAEFEKEKYKLYMREYLSNTLGNPTVYSQEFLDSELGNWFKSTPYYMFTDDYIMRNYTKFRGMFTKYIPKNVRISAMELSLLRNELGRDLTEEDIIAAQRKKFEEGLKDTSLEGKRKQAQLMKRLAGAEGKFELASLLFSPKTAVVNIVSGHENTAILHGTRNLFRAMKVQTWRDLGLKYNGRPVESIGDVWKWVAEQGIIEEFLTKEFDLTLPDKYKHGRYSDFMNALFEKIRENPEYSDASLKELADEFGIEDEFLSVAGVFIGKTERINRANAFLAAILEQADIWESAGLAIDSEYFIEIGKRAVEWSQFLYDNSNKPLFAQTSMGTIFNRFKLWGYRSVTFRRRIAEEAKAAGYEPNSPERKRFERMLIADAFILALSTLLPYSMFDYSMPSPYNWLQSLSDWLFGNEKEREHAYFIKSFGLPTALGPISEALPPMARTPKALYDSFDTVFAMITGGQIPDTASYTMWSIFPFGRAAKDVVRVIKSPGMATDFLTGFPLHKIGRVIDNFTPAVDNKEHLYFAFRP